MKTPTFFLLLSLCLFSVKPVAAGIPWMEVEYSCRSASPVSVLVVPDGSGSPLSDAQLFGGAGIDATIDVIIMDANYDPIIDFPYQDIWLESANGGLVLCPSGSIADVNTDALGRTTISGPILGGGYSDPQCELAYVVVNDIFWGAGVSMFFNSPDINGDLVVNLSDVVVFAQVYSGPCEYRCDFAWDGFVNLSDVVVMAKAFGTACP